MLASPYTGPENHPVRVPRVAADPTGTILVLRPVFAPRVIRLFTTRSVRRAR